MADLYYSPVSYGIHDVTIQGSTSRFANRVYYPSEEGTVWDAPIRPGKYPLVIFAHGDRSGVPGLCPADITEDYQKWGAVLHLLARCGFVVAVPAVHDIVSSSDSTAVRLEETVKWMRSHWVGREMLHYPPALSQEASRLTAGNKTSPDSGAENYRAAQAAPFSPFIPLPPRISLGWPTALGLVGHSWGARACAKVAVRGQVKVRALAAIAGSWDESDSITALRGANDPTLLMAGTQDFLNLSYLRGLWPSLVRPKHQAAIQGLGHWDWFGGQGGIHPCNPNAEDPACPVGWQIASELLLGFMTKYLLDHWWWPSRLLGSPGERPPLLPWLEHSTGCALKIRWDDPMASTPPGTAGEVTLGGWSESAPW